MAVHFGWVTLLAGAGILWLTWRPGRFARRQRAIVTGLAVVAALMCGLVVIGASHSADGAALQPSWGVYLTLIASIGAGASGRSARS